MSVVVNQANNDPAVNPVNRQVGFGKLVGYRIEISDDGKDWTKYKPVKIGAKLDVVYSYSEETGKVTETEQTLVACTDGTQNGCVVEFNHKGLHQKATRHYRASTINNAPGAR